MLQQQFDGQMTMIYKGTDGIHRDVSVDMKPAPYTVTLDTGSNAHKWHLNEPNGLRVERCGIALCSCCARYAK
jgi:hypothetical protein